MGDDVLVLEPSAVLPAWVAADVIAGLEEHDVAQGGVWAASVGLWQRYDRQWDGQLRAADGRPGGARGQAQLVGAIGAVYGTPTRFDITIYRVTLTEHGRAEGWTHDSLLNDALRHARVTLDQLPRAQSSAVPAPLRVAGLRRATP